MDKKCEKLRSKICLRYIFIIPIIAFSLLGIIYVLENILDEFIIDLLSVFFITNDPFALFRELFMIIEPIIIIIAIVFIIYFLNRCLSDYLSQMMQACENLFVRKKRHVELCDELGELEQILKERQAEIEAYELELQSIDRKKRDLIYLLAQDIKLPLSNLMVLLELIRTQEGLDTNVKKQILNLALDKAYDLETMMNEFFDTARFNLQYAKWKGSHFYLDRILYQVISEYFTDFESKNAKLELNIENNLYMYGDNDKIARVFRDLLTNAYALCKKDSNIEISLKQVDDFYEFVLKVPSFYFEANELEQIFNNYYQVKYREYYGNAHVLGLSVAKSIVEMHNASIHAQSFNDELTFVILLPIERKDDGDESRS